MPTDTGEFQGHSAVRVPRINVGPGPMLELVVHRKGGAFMCFLIS